MAPAHFNRQVIVEEEAVGFHYEVTEPPEEGDGTFILYWGFLNPGFRKKKSGGQQVRKKGDEGEGKRLYVI